MNNFRSLLSVIVVGMLFSSIDNDAAGADTRVNSLLRVDKDQTPDLRKAIADLLLVTPADCGRMVVRPSWEPEYAVAIYSRPDSHSSEVSYWVTLTRASMSISYALENKLPLTQIKVERNDAAVLQSTALALRRLWNEMLSHVGKDRVPDDYFAPVDGGIVEFGLADRQAERIGELPTNAGNDLEAFERLGMLVAEYPRAPSSKQPVLAHQIEHDANALNERVRRSSSK